MNFLHSVGFNKKKTKDKTYICRLFPNNQPIIELGEIIAENEKEAKFKICKEYGLSITDDNLCIKERV